MDQTRPATILVVDDNEGDRKLLESLLAAEAYMIRSAASGEEALASVAEQLPDLVLLDIMMPGIDGFEVTRRLKADSRTRSIPIILVTALEDRDSRLKGLEMGAEEFLNKPVNRAELSVRVRNLLKIKAYNDLLADHNCLLKKQVEMRTTELQESEARYRRITEGLTDYLYTVRIENGRAVETTQSPACAAVTGYTAEEFGADPQLWIQMVVPEDRYLVLEHVRQILAGNHVTAIEHRIIRKDGEIRWISDTTIPFKDDAGKLLSYDGVIKDITERKQADESIRISQARFGAIFNQAPLGIALIDSFTGQIYEVNPRFAEIAGRTLEEMTTIDWMSITHPDDVQVDLDNMALLNAGKIPGFRMDKRYLRPDGSIVWISMTVAPLSVEQNISPRHLCMIENITEQKKAEESLRESEKRYHTLFETMHEGFSIDEIICDETGKPFDLRYLAVNPAFELQTGLKATDIIGRTTLELFPDAEPVWFERYGKVALTGEPAHFEEKFGPLGRWYDVSAYQTEPGRFAVMFLDITQRKQAEAAIQHAHRALATLGAVNRNLVHATDENELLQAVCQAIVEQNGYRMAWVGYKQQDEGKSIKIMAHAGRDEGYLEAMQFTWAESERGMFPCGCAIRSGTTQVCQDIAHDSQYLPWRDAALQRGYAANIALPLTYRNGKVFGALAVYSNELNSFSTAEIALLEEMAGDLAFGVRSLHVRQERDLALAKNQEQLAQLQDSLEDTVQAMAGLVEMRDPYTAGHQNKVADLAVAIARQLGLPEEQIHAIHLAGVVHDLGKIKVPAEILSKPGKINDLEFGLIKVHPQAGYDILKGIDFPWPIAQMVLQHHERLDGSGYPQGLKGDDILLEARILSVADVIEAMSSHRPYRPGLGIEVALAEITKQRGVHYDSQVVDACLTLFREQGYALPVGLLT